MKSRWEAGVDALESRYSGWWSNSDGSAGEGVVMVMVEVGVVSFSERMCFFQWQRWNV